MTHDPDERLLAAARGTPLPESDAASPGDHQLEQFATRIGTAARGAQNAPDFEAPPEGLWASIAASLDLDKAPIHHADDTNVIPLASSDVHSRSWRRWTAGLVAASIIGLVTIAAVTASQSDDDTVIQQVALKPLTEGGTGNVELVRHDGRLELKVKASLEPNAGHYYELWLLNRDVSGLISLGPLQSGRSYPLPQGMRLDRFPIVDVSIEREDGNPLHSSKSVLRGDLGDTPRTV